MQQEEGTMEERIAQLKNELKEQREYYEEWKTHYMWNPLPLDRDAAKRREICETEERLKAAERTWRSEKRRRGRELARQRKAVASQRKEKNEVNRSKRPVKKAKLL
jgi:hypothetical protein